MNSETAKHNQAKHRASRGEPKVRFARMTWDEIDALKKAGEEIAENSDGTVTVSDGRVFRVAKRTNRLSI